MRAFKAHLRGLSPYPYKKEEAPVKLDQNESPFDLPGALKEEALGRLRAIPWNRYPEIHAESLRKRLSALLDWPEEGIVLAPGSNLLILALSLAAEEVLDLRPSFPHYAHAAKVAGTPYRAVPLGEGFSLDLKALLAAFRGGVLFLPNPHAPTGALFPEEALRALAERAKEVGGFWWWTRPTGSLPGRTSASSPGKTPTWPCFAPSPRPSPWGSAPGTSWEARRWRGWCGRCCPLRPPRPHRGRPGGGLGKPGLRGEGGGGGGGPEERVYRELLAHPTWRPYPSRTNFLLVRTPDAEEAFRHLLSQGVLVRRQDRYPGLAGCLRVTVGRREEMDAFLRAAFGVAYA